MRAQVNTAVYLCPHHSIKINYPFE